jgi:hypothetical protein
MPTPIADAVLLYPPITDPTAPYHSLVYLASYARAHGFPDVAVRDTNVEALHYCARPAVLGELMAGWEERRRRLGAKPSLARGEQLEYLHLTRAGGLEPDDPQKAIAALRDPATFYDYAIYRDAVRCLQLWMASLSCEAFPGQFKAGGHALEASLFSKSSVADLTDEAVLDRVVGPFRPYYHHELFPDLSRRRPAVVGINVTYTSQLPYALWLVRQLRRLLPDACIVCGGTEVSGVWKYLVDRMYFGRLFQGADACVIGEGESAFVALLEAVSAGKNPGAIPNVVQLDRRRGRHAPPPDVVYEDLDRLPAPEYALLRPDLYFSPHPLVYYSPTRGCYWNKCTFCDYGLNFGTPTSPWRQRGLERTIDDLRAAARFTPFLYLSVDVLAPGALLKLAQGIVDADIDVRWAAEIRLEKYFTRERCELLRQSGCVAVSVGFESGSQRILDRIRKGTRLDDVETTIRGFTEAGIAVQMMGFTGFPTESCADAMASIDYLLRNEDSWTVAGLGDFVLTPGAIVAQRPTDFGIRDVRPAAGDDIAVFLRFRESTPARTPEEERAVRQAKRQLGRTEFDRPYAGGIDTAHSIFYYARYGLRFPRAFVPRGRPADVPCPDGAPLALNGRLLAGERYDLLSLFDTRDLVALHESAFRAGFSLDARSLREDLAKEEGRAFPGDGDAYFLRRDGALLPCPAPVQRFLAHVNGERTLAEIIARAASEEAGPEDLHDLVAYTRIVSHLANGEGASAAGPMPTPKVTDAAGAYRLLARALLAQHVLVAGGPVPESSPLCSLFTGRRIV